MLAARSLRQNLGLLLLRELGLCDSVGGPDGGSRPLLLASRCASRFAILGARSACWQTASKVSFGQTTTSTTEIQLCSCLKVFAPRGSREWQPMHEMASQLPALRNRPEDPTRGAHDTGSMYRHDSVCWQYDTTALWPRKP